MKKQRFMLENQSFRIRKKDRKDFVKAINLLNKLMANVLEYEPNAEYFCQGNDIYLMVEPSHSASGDQEIDNCAMCGAILRTDSGAW